MDSRRRMKDICLIVGFLAASILCGTCQLQSAGPEHSSHEDGPVALTLGEVTPLRAVLRIASENKIALGIVFGTHPLLCSQERSMKINATHFKEAFSDALAGTGYTVAREGGTYVLMAPDATEHEAKLLNFTFDQFSATDSTMNDAGQLLAGYIKTTVEGAQSFATASSVGPSSKTLTIKMRSANT